MKYAVTGSNGFIGSHLSKKLSSLGHTVLPITREVLYEPLALTELLRRENPDYIYHLASYGNHSTQEDVPMTIFSNIIGTFNLLSAGNHIPYKKFVYFSSSSVYLPMETYYSAAKAGAERICNAFRQQQVKPIIIVRPYSVYGPGEADFRFIPTVIRCIETKETLTLDPAPIHDWIYVEDFVDILLKNQDLNVDIDIGTGIGQTNGNIVEKLVKIAGKTVKTDKVSGLRSYDNDAWIANHGQKTKHSLDEGLAKTYEFYKNQYKN